MFRRRGYSRSYSTGSSYSSRRGYSSYGGSGYGRSRIKWGRIAIIAGIVALLLIILVWFNFDRIRLMIKGYSFSQQSEILKLEDEAVDEILTHSKMDHISDWINTSENYEYYDEYENYITINSDTEIEAVVELIDEVFTDYVPKLKAMSYSEDQIWTLLETASADDIAYVVKKQYTYDDLEPYMEVTGFQFQDMADYIKVYKEKKSYTYAVLITNYPFIDSSNESDDQYTLADPDDILNLVKKGFYLPSDYEPDDLVTPDVLISPDCESENAQMREEAAEALEEMFAAAEQEGYYLVINSAYRSYEAQQETYEEYFEKYDEVTAASLVALPGASEHQTGLGVDLTCQSVLDDKADGIDSKFSYKPDYKWCAANSYKYGFILRYEGDKADITGIANEEWHFRYVGVEAATEIFNNGWTLEEYVLYNGALPELE